MPNRLVILLFLLLSISHGHAQRIAFLRGSAMLTGDVSNGAFDVKAKLEGHVAKGDDIQLSPDGKCVAYTFTVDVKAPKGSGRPGFERFIEISDLDGKNRATLKTSPEKNDFGPLWSPDGLSIAFHTLIRNPTSSDLQWCIGIGKRDLDAASVLRNPLFDHGYFVFTWTPAGDLAVLGNDTLNVISPSGVLRRSARLGLDTLGGTEYSPSSADMLCVSPDGRFIAWIVDGSDDGSKNFEAIYEEGLYGILLVYDQTTHSLQRLSPKTLSVAFEPPVWLPDQSGLVFGAIEAATPLREGARPTTDLFRLSLVGSSLHRLASNGHCPVVLH